MTNCKYGPALSGVGGRHIDALARRVISELRSKPSGDFRLRLSDATAWLVEMAMSPRVLCLEAMRDALRARGLSAVDIIDRCIPDAAREMGRLWVEDEASFAIVSLGSARLHGLCRLLMSDWDGNKVPVRSAPVLIAVCENEDHLIGPVVLADQMRRAGHSVHLMTRARPDLLLSKLLAEPFGVLLISCGAMICLENVARTVLHLRSGMARTPNIILGGPVIECVDGLKEQTGVDLVTNSFELALAASGEQGADRMATGT